MHIVQIGCGVVGKAYVDAFRNKGHKVSIIEANKDLVTKYSGYHIHDDLSTIENVDFIMISVFTPLVGDSLTMQYIYSTLPNVATIVKNSPNAIILIRSTVKPMTSRSYRTQLENLVNFKANIVFQPEFLRAKSAFEDALNPWCVVFGVGPDIEGNLLQKLIDFYGMFISEDHIHIMSYEEAELLKLWHNTFNACKISYFNACQLMASAIEKDNNIKINTSYITEMMTKTCEGLINPKYGTTPGHAYYGTCLPKDSAEMKFLEQQYLSTSFMKAIVDINDIFQKTDKCEFLDGDNHISHEKIKQII